MARSASKAASARWPDANILAIPLPAHATVPATNKHVEFDWLGLAQVKGGKVAAASVYFDNLGLMQQLGLSERLHETEVIDAWKNIVGEFIAAHSCPISLRAGVLLVRVLQPTLHYQFEQISKAEILRKLKQRFGRKIIRDIRFRVG